MFHYRWRYQPDVWSTAERIAQQMMGAQGTLAVAQARAAVAERMMGRLGFVGSNEKTQPLIEASFAKALGLIDAHLASRPYLLGGRPAMADFGLWGQLYEAATDPDARRDHARLGTERNGLGAAHGSRRRPKADSRRWRRSRRR